MKTIIFITQRKTYQNCATARKFGALFWLNVCYIKGSCQALIYYYENEMYKHTFIFSDQQ